jgi:hypothetical protein
MATVDVAATEETVFPDAEAAAAGEDVQAPEGTGAAVAEAPEGTVVAVVDGTVRWSPVFGQAAKANSD